MTPSPGRDLGRIHCDVCRKELEGEEKEFAEAQENHPGYLGLIDRGCYSQLIDVDPALPWTDSISGETDYGAMQEDLGVDTGEEDLWADADGGSDPGDEWG